MRNHWSLYFPEPMPPWLKHARSAAAALQRRGDCALASSITFHKTLVLIEADDLPTPAVGPYGAAGLVADWSEDTRRVLLIAEGASARWIRFAGLMEQSIPTAYQNSAVTLARENLAWLRGGSLFSPSAFTQSILEELAKGGRLL